MLELFDVAKNRFNSIIQKRLRSAIDKKCNFIRHERRQDTDTFFSQYQYQLG